MTGPNDASGTREIRKGASATDTPCVRRSFLFFFLEPRIYVRFECANPRARTNSVKRAWTLKKNSGRTEFDRDYDGSGECKNENTPETNVDVGDATTVRRIWRVREDSLNFLNKYYVL